MAQQNSLSQKTHFWHPLFRKIAGTSWGSGLSSQIMHRADKPIYKWSNGRTTLSTILTGVPVIKLTTIGAKSGQPRTVPLTCIPKGKELVLIASNWGGKKHPAWYHNLKANPQAEVSYQGNVQRYLATEVFGEEREVCWQTAVSVYPGYKTYAQRVQNRSIPVLKLTPADN